MCMAVTNTETAAKARTDLNELVELARLPAKTQMHVSEASFLDALSQMPGADINFFGPPKILIRHS